MGAIFRETKHNIQFEATTVLNYPPHIHDDVELVYVLAGGGTLHCDGRPYVMEAGQFYVIFPHQVHRYTDCIGGNYRLLILKPTRLLHYSSLFESGQPTHPTVCLPTGEAARASQLMQAALEEYTQQGDSGVLDGYFTALFGSLLRHCPVGPAVAGRDCLSALLTYCGHHYREPLTVDSVSRALHISRSHISHLFSDRLKMGFCDYIHALRLSEATGFLVQERYTVTEIAYRVGYSSLRTFNRAFRQVYGTTPTAYRRENS